MRISTESAGYLIDALKVRIEETSQLIASLQSERNELEQQSLSIQERIQSLVRKKDILGHGVKVLELEEAT